MPIDFIALDFETANPKRASVIQVGIARVRDGAVTSRFSSFVSPPPGFERFEPRLSGIHGLHPRDVVGAPGWPEILERIIVFTGDLPVVAHNASMERSVIVQASEAHGITPPSLPYFCSLKLARKIYSAERSHSLGILSARLGLPLFSHHDAAADAVASAELVLHVMRQQQLTDLHAMPFAFMS